MRRIALTFLLVFGLALTSGCFSRSTEAVQGKDMKSRTGVKDSDTEQGKDKKKKGVVGGGVPAD
jgi:hypothetical protein